jgi:hypothetical protein
LRAPGEENLFSDPIRRGLDFLALLSCNVTDRWEQRVIAYGSTQKDTTNSQIIPNRA